MAWTARRASGPVIHWLSPDAVAIRPSRLVASLSVTRGRPVALRSRKPAWSCIASAARTPVVTAIPAARNRAKPCPETRGSVSSSGATTRATPAAISASTQGGVRP